MAQIVVIDKGTLRDNCSIGDVVAIHDDDVKLDGAGYEGFHIIHVKGVSAKSVREKLQELTPQTSTAYKAAVGNTWTLTPPEEQEVWKNLKDGKWYFLKNRPKYVVNLSAITESDENMLKSNSAKVEDKLALLAARTAENYSKDSLNLVEAVDINKELGIG